MEQYLYCEAAAKRRKNDRIIGNMNGKCRDTNGNSTRRRDIVRNIKQHLGRSETGVLPRFSWCSKAQSHVSDTSLLRVVTSRRSLLPPYIFSRVSTFLLCLDVFPCISMFSVASRRFRSRPDVFAHVPTFSPASRRFRSCLDVFPLSSQYLVPSEFPRVASLDDI